MDARDRSLFIELRRDARQKITVLARKLQIPSSSAWDRLRRLQRRFPLRHTSLLNFMQLGLPLHVQLLIWVSRDEEQQLVRYLTGCWWVNNLYHVKGSADLLADGLFRDMKAYFESTQELTDRFNIDMRTHHLVEEIKKEGFYSSHHLDGEQE